ncbi:hypothetical protein [Komagataeibacter swingsii]|uniref:hypothetical protein n=1 Tax=Komagataeibacter swingsii TaxID=215220 RepID=UPI0011B41402|nr:hypothetical protein [Komagataeibacter swingsii]GBQ64454.1 hypothetical protein AA16373_2905 [Komagataeibacter swingsii DSM 16373]
MCDILGLSGKSYKFSWEDSLPEERGVYIIAPKSKDNYIYRTFEPVMGYSENLKNDGVKIKQIKDKYDYICDVDILIYTGKDSENVFKDIEYNFNS